jgi:hypothetical protein
LEIPLPFLLATDGALQMAFCRFLHTPPFLFSSSYHFPFSRWLLALLTYIQNSLSPSYHYNCLNRGFASMRTNG